MSRCLLRQTQCVYPCQIGINDGGKGNFLAIVMSEYLKLPVISLHIHCLAHNMVRRIFLYIKELYVSKKTGKPCGAFPCFCSSRLSDRTRLYATLSCIILAGLLFLELPVGTIAQN